MSLEDARLPFEGEYYLKSCFQILEVVGGSCYRNSSSCCNYNDGVGNSNEAKSALDTSDKAQISSAHRVFPD